MAALIEVTALILGRFASVINPRVHAHRALINMKIVICWGGENIPYSSPALGGGSSNLAPLLVSP